MSRKELPPIVNAALAGLYALSATGAGLFEGKINPDPNVPKASLLRSGQPKSAGEVCGGDLPQLVITSPSSYICIETPRILAAPPIKPQPEIITPAPAREQQPILITYTVKRGDTFSEIIGQQFGFGLDQVYGEHFRDTVWQNADLLARKSPEAKKALEELWEHPDWTPRTSFKAFVLFMRATRLINPGDTIAFAFKESLIPASPQDESREIRRSEEIKPLITQPLPGFFGSGICDEQWGSQPQGNKVCEGKPPYRQCVQLGSGDTPSYTCAKTQIGGRVEGDMKELEDSYFVVDKCSAIPGPCIGHLEKAKK